jgi:hypothetical protein
VHPNLLADQRQIDYIMKKKTATILILHPIPWSRFMQIISPTRYASIVSLAAPLKHHQAINALLGNCLDAQVYVDAPEHPSLFLARIQSRVYLSAKGQTEAIPQIQDCLAQSEFWQDRREFLLLFAPEEWNERLPHLLPGWKAYPGVREYYQARPIRKEWRSHLPPGYTIQAVTAKLLRGTELSGMEALKEEMVSERPTVEDFLEKSFGVCLFFEHELAGWCLSEYNTPIGCEVGIATLPPHQRRGFATLMTSAFMAMAIEHGIETIGWDCWQKNLPSSGAARKAGFELTHTDLVGYFVKDES